MGGGTGGTPLQKWKREWFADDTSLQDGRGTLKQPGKITRAMDPAPKEVDKKKKVTREAPARLPSQTTRPAPPPTSEPAPTGPPRDTTPKRGLPPVVETAEEPPETYDPAKTDFVKSMHRTLRSRWAIERTGARDQATGNPYSEERREALERKFGGHPLAKEFGLRTTANMDLTFDKDSQAGIRIRHDDSSIYLRDAASGQAEARLKEVFAKKFPGEATLPTFENRPDKSQALAQIFFVNAPETDIAARLTAFHGSTWGGVKKTYSAANTASGDQTVTIRAVSDGIHSIKFVPGLSYKSRMGDTKKSGSNSDAHWFQKGALEPLGATPSTYDAIRAASMPDLSATPVAPLDDPRLKVPNSSGGGFVDQKNEETVRALATTPGVQSLKDLPKTHPMKVIATTAVDMVTSLEKTLADVMRSKGEAFGQNAMVADALASLKTLMAAAPSYLEDTPRFTKMFDLMIDEVYLILGVCQPYDADKYDDAVKTELKRRAPILEEELSDVPVHSHLVTSGMDSLATAVMAASKADAGGGVTLLAPDSSDPSAPRSPNYFQIEMELLHSSAPIRGEGRVIAGTLNPSSPVSTLDTGSADEWDVDSLKRDIRSRMSALAPAADAANPVFVIVDATVEKAAEKTADEELQKLFTEFKAELKSGAMTITLCKSYQKYPSLGSGKIMMGGVTVIGKSTAMDDAVAQTSANRDPMKKDEAQLMTHLISMGDRETPDADVGFDPERQMLKRAAENASVLKSFMGDATDPNQIEYADGLPFVFCGLQELNFEYTPGERDRPSRTTDKPSVRPDLLMRQLGVEGRFSFGFQNSSCLHIPGGVRICAGNEPEEEVVEKFYAVSQLAKAPPKAIAEVETAQDAAKRDISAAVVPQTVIPLATVKQKATERVNAMVDARAADFIPRTNLGRLKGDARNAMHGVLDTAAAATPPATSFATEAEVAQTLKTAARAASQVIQARLKDKKGQLKVMGDAIERETQAESLWPSAEVKRLTRLQVEPKIRGIPSMTDPGITLDQVVRDALSEADDLIDTRARNGGFPDANKAEKAAIAAGKAAIKHAMGALKVSVTVGDVKGLAAGAAGKAAGEVVDLVGAPPDLTDPAMYGAWREEAESLLVAAGLRPREPKVLQSLSDAKQAILASHGPPPDKAEDLGTWRGKAVDLLLERGMWDTKPADFKADEILFAAEPPTEFEGSAAALNTKLGANAVSHRETLSKQLSALKNGKSEGGTALLDAAGKPIDPITAQLKAVQATVGPVLTDEQRQGSDVVAMRASAKKGFPGHPGNEPSFEAKNLPNIVASCALVGAAAFDNDETRAEAMGMIDMLMERNMDGVSTEARELLCTRRAEMEVSATTDMAGLDSDALAKKRAVFEKCVKTAPYREAAAGLFKDTMPDNVFAKPAEIATAGPEKDARDKKWTEQQALGAAFLDRLDLETETLLLETLAGKEASQHKARMCHDHLKARLAKAKSDVQGGITSGQPPLAAERLEGGALSGEGGPVEMKLDDVVKLEQRLTAQTSKLI